MNLQLDLPIPRLIRALAAEFRALGIISPESDAEWLLAHVLQVGRAELYLHPERILNRSQQRQVEELYHRRLQREPLQYLLGSTEFFGLTLDVVREVLIPRPETELLVERVIALADGFSAPRIIDLGTGSGCIAVTLTKMLPRAQVTAIDKSATALRLARHNAERLGVTDRIEFQHLDMTSPQQMAQLNTFDLVVSNPPYVLESEREQLQEEIRNYEPAMALFADGDGLEFYRRILEFCQAHLTAGGWVACEMASPRWQEIRQLFRTSDFCKIEIINDYAGLQRHLIGQRKTGANE